jgi:hypothetical protein
MEVERKESIKKFGIGLDFEHLIMAINREERIK